MNRVLNDNQINTRSTTSNQQPPSRTAIRKLNKEFQSFQNNRTKGIHLAYHEDNILEWHYVVEGPEDTPYSGGFYWGKLVFPPNFPFAPPAIYMFTPSGRFSTNTRICTTMSDYHPETWSPMWSLPTIVVGLVSFMVQNEQTAGSINTPDEKKRELAKKSLEYNLNYDEFQELFPELKTPE